MMKFIQRFCMIGFFGLCPILNHAGDDGLGIARFEIPKPLLVWERPAQLWSHIESVGEAAGIWGNAGGPLEAWIYPFQLFRDLELRVSLDEGKTFQEARDLIRLQTATPYLGQLRLVDDSFIITQTLFTPRTLPGVMMLLEVDTAQDLWIQVKFSPTLAPMHLKTPPPDIHWDGGRRELVAREATNHVELRARFPFAESSRPLENGAWAITLRISPADARNFLIPMLFGLSWPEGASADATLATMRDHFGDLLEESIRHYQTLLDHAPEVRSPDPLVNEAMRWSTVSLDQLRIKNPYLGYGLVSGYSLSRNETVPRYCWFFDEPTLSSWAYHRVGLSGHVRDAFRMLMRYQREDGKTVHEIPQSLPFQPDFFQTSMYAYIHTDGPVYFLAAYGEYYRQTGDLALIREHWPNIRRGLEWCFSLVDSEDGLIRIEPGSWGSSESSFTIWKDTNLEAVWIKALKEMAGLAEVMEEEDLADRCRTAAARAAESLEKTFWNEKRSFYLWGIDREGRPVSDLVPYLAVGIWFDSFQKDRAAKALEQMAGSDFRSDWGVRSHSLSNPGYDPAAYQTGSAWPVWNAGVIIGDYRRHQAVEGFRNWMSMVRLRQLDGLGPMPEVLHGHVYKRLKEGVPHQMFAETALVNGFYEGLLGLEIDVPENTVHLSPALPPAWNELEIKRNPFGDNSFDVSLHKTQKSLQIEIDPGNNTDTRFILSPSLPAGSRVTAVTTDGLRFPCEVETHPSATVPHIALPTKSGRRTIEIKHTPGLAVMPLDEEPQPGDTSRNLRIIRAGFDQGEWRMTVEGLPGREYRMNVYTDRIPQTITGAERGETVPERFILLLKAPAEGKVMNSGYIRWDVRMAWGGE